MVPPEEVDTRLETKEEILRQISETIGVIGVDDLPEAIVNRCGRGSRRCWFRFVWADTDYKVLKKRGEVFLVIHC